MRRVEEYEQHSEECRRIAANTRNPEHKKQLEQMAAAWTMLAEARKRQLLKEQNSSPTVKNPNARAITSEALEDRS